MIRIDEAIKAAKMNGRKVLKQDLAARLWPESAPETQRVNMTNLCKGKVEKVKPEHIRIICETLGCSADFLFNINTKTDESN